MDWTEGEARLATLEREVIRHQRLTWEQQALARHDGRVAAVERRPLLWRWLGCQLWRRLPLPAEPAPAVGNPTRMRRGWPDRGRRPVVPESRAPRLPAGSTVLPA
jgi:hypothetical protein